MTDDSDDIINIKVILLGNCGVGKTSIINRYIHNQFNPYMESTLGSSCASKKIIKNDITYKLNIWDTTGQEKYHSITNLFMKGSQIVILVYSIDSLSSFEGLDYWYKTFQEKVEGNNYVLAVVGNKSDLIKVEEEAVSEEEAIKFANERNAHFTLISTKEDPVSVNTLFEKLLEELINSNLITVNKTYIIEKKKHKTKVKKKKCC